MATLPDYDPKPITTETAWRSDGDSIPFVAAGGEKVGDIVVRAAAFQQIGQVQALRNSEDVTATAGDIITLRVTGRIQAPKEAATADDGDFATWDDTAKVMKFSAVGFATGSHEVVGGYASGDAYVLVRMNILPRAAS